MGQVISIGKQDYVSLRENHYFYIDKTALMYQMVKTGRYYFLSRPRRFGTVSYTHLTLPTIA